MCTLISKRRQLSRLKLMMSHIFFISILNYTSQIKNEQWHTLCFHRHISAWEFWTVWYHFIRNDLLCIFKRASLSVIVHSYMTHNYPFALYYSLNRNKAVFPPGLMFIQKGTHNISLSFQTNTTKKYGNILTDISPENVFLYCGPLKHSLWCLYNTHTGILTNKEANQYMKQNSTSQF